MGPVFDAGTGARLVASYEGNPAAWSYDQGLAVIALLAAGERDSAEAILSGLERVQSPNGEWVFAYYTRTGDPATFEFYSGTQAWVLLGFLAHWETTGSERFRPAFEKGLSVLRRMTDDDERSPTFGAVGFGGERAGTFSTEHNADARAVWNRLALLTRSAESSAASERVVRFFRRQLWSCGESKSCTNAFFRVGFRDFDFYLDAQTWTTLSLHSALRENVDFEAAVDLAYERLLVRDGVSGGASGIQGICERMPNEGYVWSEGTEGMVAALKVLGGADRIGRAERLHAETCRYQSETGGIPYATRNTNGKSESPSIAGTAWFLFNELGINPFAPLRPPIPSVHAVPRDRDRPSPTAPRTKASPRE
jgi:hypothetical protein